MCEISDDLKLCTCSNAEELENYWVLYRFNKDKNELIVGEILLPRIITLEEIRNKDILLALLNKNNCFDFEYHPHNKDRLLISLLDSTNNDFDEEYSESIAYGYEYKNGKWKIKDYETFEWYEKYDEILEGKIENLYKKKN